MSEKDRLYLAGHRAPAGRYRRVDVPDERVVELADAGVLPASLDGHVAVYRPLPLAGAVPSAEAWSPGNRHARAPD